MSRKQKVAITVSAEALAAAERLRQRTGESRSAVFERALQGLIDVERREDQCRRYLDGYRRDPERPDEVQAALTAALALLGGEAWDAEG